MTYDEIIEQLEITKNKIKEIARNEYGGESWNDDLDALTEAADIVADYSKATAQASEMSQKYEQPAMAVRRAAGLYTCPLCGKRTRRNVWQLRRRNSSDDGARVQRIEVPGL